MGSIQGCLGAGKGPEKRHPRRRCLYSGGQHCASAPGIPESRHSPCCLLDPWLQAPLMQVLLMTLLPPLQDIYENLDLRQRRASSPGYIDSPTYSRQGMSPTFSRSPHHYYRSGKEGGRPQRDRKSQGTALWFLSPAVETAWGSLRHLHHSMVPGRPMAPRPRQVPANAPGRGRGGVHGTEMPPEVGGVLLGLGMREVADRPAALAERRRLHLHRLSCPIQRGGPGDQSGLAQPRATQWLGMKRAERLREQPRWGAKRGKDAQCCWFLQPAKPDLGVKQDNGAKPVSADACMRAQHPRHPAVTTPLLPSLLPLH